MSESEQPTFETKSVEGMGISSVATKDLLPGTVLFREEIPLLSYNDSLISTYSENDAISNYLASFYSFKTKLSESEKHRYLGLYGPTDDLRADLIRKAASTIDVPILDLDSSSEIDLFVQVSCIAAMNIFMRSPNYFVFEKASRLNHSCLPNCYVDIVDGTCTCRTIAHIKQSEELTIEYNSNHRWKPTHERRYAYLISKGFTCHCPRCNATGDDTRQFDCCNPSCGGIMYACQPLNKTPIPGGVWKYTGVGYVEPHLLPCSICRTEPPQSYQTEMFALETALPDQLNRIEKADTELADTGQYNDAPALLEELCVIAARCPSHHLLNLQLKRITGFLYTKMSIQFGSTYYAPLARAMQENIDIYEYLTTFPNKAAHQFYFGVAQASRLNPAYPATDCIKYLRIALRMYLLLHGRERRQKEYDTVLADVLEPLLSEPVTLIMCAFCEEYPTQAAIQLSPCGRCGKASYCSAGCQVAHKKIHRKVCKTSNSTGNGATKKSELNHP